MLDKLFFYLDFPFVRYAIIVGMLISLCSSLLGVTLVLKRYSYIGDGLSHVAFILTVKATRARKDEKFTYERSFRLADDIDTDNIKVSLENGILKFDLAKKAQAAARKITIA